jgi:hypothetical protein
MDRAESGRSEEWSEVTRHGGVDRERRHRAHAPNQHGCSDTAECSASTVGLTLADGKRILADLQHHLVQAQSEDYCRQWRVCSHCRLQLPLKDVRARLALLKPERCETKTFLIMEALAKAKAGYRVENLDMVQDRAVGFDTRIPK